MTGKIQILSSAKQNIKGQYLDETKYFCNFVYIFENPD